VTVVMLIVTFASLAVAGVLLLYVLRLTREERDRSEARAVMLAEMLAEQSAPGQTPPLAVAADRPAERPMAVTKRTDEPVRQPETSDAFSGEVTPADAATMFAAPAHDRRDRSPLLLIPVVGVLIVGLAIGAVYLVSRPSARASQTSADATQSSLELVSLRHERQGDGLVISGLVRNPQAGHTVKGLTPVAFAFDRQGGFLTSGRGTLDFPELQPGDESPFSITIPEGASVGRYRVSFRTDAGIVPHVDRRADPPAAQAAVR
jgi:hypothetical protein